MPLPYSSSCSSWISAVPAKQAKDASHSSSSIQQEAMLLVVQHQQLMLLMAPQCTVMMW
jgi:hypothetical protein